jgi:hypothetical protein
MKHNVFSRKLAKPAVTPEEEYQLGSPEDELQLGSSRTTQPGSQEEDLCLDLKKHQAWLSKITSKYKFRKSKFRISTFLLWECIS